MILITGGKYQGKLRCAMEVTEYTEDDVFDFAKLNSYEYATSHIDYSKCAVWNNLDEYIRSLALSGTEEPQLEKMMNKLLENNNPKVIIMSEVGAGVIPIDKEENAFREVTGRLAASLAGKAAEVYRVICGLNMKLK